MRTLFAIHDAVDLARLELPWWTYGAIGEIDAFLLGRRHARVFEFGSGASTVFLAHRVTSLHTVEHDVAFADVVRSMVAGMPHVELDLAPPVRVEDRDTAVRSARSGYREADFTPYVERIDRVGGSFDLIVIDGRARVECLRRALTHLVEDGVILFDDAGRRRYRSALRTSELDVRVHRGLRPCLFYPTSTALVRRSAG